MSTNRLSIRQDTMWLFFVYFYFMQFYVDMILHKISYKETFMHTNTTHRSAIFEEWFT